MFIDFSSSFFLLLLRTYCVKAKLKSSSNPRLLRVNNSCLISKLSTQIQLRNWLKSHMKKTFLTSKLYAYELFWKIMFTYNLHTFVHMQIIIAIHSCIVRKRLILLYVFNKLQKKKVRAREMRSLLNKIKKSIQKLFVKSNLYTRI